MPLLQNRTRQAIISKANDLGLKTTYIKKQKLSHKKGSISVYDFCQNNPDYQHLLKEWNYDKNIEYDINKISYQSGVKVWWKCDKGHEWKAIVSSRTRGINCPVCANQLIIAGINDFKTTTSFSYLLDEWDYEENDKIGLFPDKVPSGSKQKAHWKCRKCGKKWQATISSRNNGHGCPDCMNQGTSYPEMALLHYLSNIYTDIIHRHKIDKIEFDLYVPSIDLAIEYDGSYWHKNKLDKENEKDQFCKNNNIRFIRLRAEGLPSTISAETIWFKDNSEHNISLGIIALFDYLNIKPDFEINLINDYISIMNTRVNKEKEKSLSVVAPNIAAEWHPTKNGNLKPENVSFGSPRKVYWLGKCGHEWKTSIVDRVNKNYGCPICAGQKTVSGINDLKTKIPEIVSDWDYEKNGNLKPEDVYYLSNKKVFWKCHICNYEWSATIANRVRNNSGCPRCNKSKPYSEEELNLIFSHYEELGAKGISKLLPDRSIESIKAKASSLGLKYNNPALWTDEKIEILKEYYPIEGKDIIKRLPNKTWEQIKTKVYRLGIIKS